MPLIGTAGHVDHGKSTLVERITGRDPDRWDEEKQRGLTIDLGFAWVVLPGGTEVSFVDVPGHERYLKNMLAGIEAIDVALFVVAADEGWMPQSEEHLAVLDLLEVDRGIVALTKTDLVDEDLIQLASLEVEEQLKGTSLENAQVIPVSGTTGAGVTELIEGIDRLVAEITIADVGRPRLWVDRSFTSSGAGTVVTGTLLDGSLETGQVVELLPGGSTARIRAIQSHERTLQVAEPGSRVALNLSGVDRNSISRGDMIGLPGQWETTDRLLASVRTARYAEALEKKGAFQLHLGSSVRETRITAKNDDYLVVQLDRAIPTAVGDRFVIRDTGRRLVVAGGRVIDPSPGASKRSIETAPAIDPGSTSDEIAATLLDLRGREKASRLDAHSRGGQPANAVRVGDVLASRRLFKDLAGSALQLVAEEHDHHPLRVGLPIATLAERLGVGIDLTEAIVESESGLERVGPHIRSTGHHVELGTKALTVWKRAELALSEGLDVPSVSELALDPELLHVMIRDRKLVRIADDLVYLPEQTEELKTAIRALPGEFTVADFRDSVGLSRKYVVPILEWADKEGLTVRRGNLRTIR